nr:3-phytase [uncultured bacterium]
MCYWHLHEESQAPGYGINWNTMLPCTDQYFMCPYWRFICVINDYQNSGIVMPNLPIQCSDIMDDLATWVNTKDPCTYKSKSLILATNKEEPYGGIYVSSLDGVILKIAPNEHRHWSIRANFSYPHTVMDIAAATYKKDKGLAFAADDPLQKQEDGYLCLGDHEPVVANSQKLSFMQNSAGARQGDAADDPLQKQEDGFYAIKNFKYTGAEKWQFWCENWIIHMEKVLSYPIQSLCEGKVVKDHTGTVFIGCEPDRGIWAFPEKAPIMNSGDNCLTADVEGLGLYAAKYLIAVICNYKNSQGSCSYFHQIIVPYSFHGSFKKYIMFNPCAGQEGIIDVTEANLGSPYTNGLFVGHDNRNSLGAGSNFKLLPWDLVPWDDLARAIGLISPRKIKFWHDRNDA